MADDPKPEPLPYARMAFHAGLAGVVFFVFNRFALGQASDISLVWGLVAAPMAAYLAYAQSRR